MARKTDFSGSGQFSIDALDLEFDNFQKQIDDIHLSFQDEQGDPGDRGPRGDK